MADVEAIKYVSQLNGYLVIMYQIFMTNPILSFDLIDNQLRVTIGFKVFHPHLSAESEANEQNIVLRYIIETRFL